MTTPLLTLVLEPIVRRHRRQRISIVQAIGALGLLATTLAMRVSGNTFELSALFIFFAALLICIVARRSAARWSPDYREIARRVEAQHPDLHALLLTAVEQQPDVKTQRLSFLQQRVVAEATAKARTQNWLGAVPFWRLAGLDAVALAAFLAAFLPTFEWRAHRAAPPVVSKQAVDVTPGDISLERGSGLVVLAKFNRDVPGAATLVLQPKNEPEQRMPLVKNLDDPVFGGGLPEVQGDLTYRVEYAGAATRDFAVKVFEHPRLDRADATLHFPEYTKLADKAVPETCRVSAVEGTKINVAFQLNKPVKSATLVAKDGTTVPLAVQAGKPLAELRDFPLKASASYELKLEDEDGRANKVPAQFIVEALPNRRPELKFQTPKGDQRVSPIEEVAFRAQAWDDFGLARYGITVNVAGRAAQDIELGQNTRTDERREVAHLLKLEELGVQPDDLVSWFLWAEDTGPDGQPRRTATDMFFAEVRPFEEIFRPGDGAAAAAAAGAAAGAGEEEMKLAELQKQIVSATWNLQRAEHAKPGADGPSEKYRKDEAVILDSQAKALEQAKALAEKADDAKAKALVEAAAQAMQSAHDHLTKAADTTAPLPDALAAEQAAYSALLKLAAHEFRVVRNQKGQGKGKGGGKQQQQLDEMEMKDEEKRYETKSEAAPQQAEQQREQLAILNRLKELAQRQNDINERLKELQTALQEAKTEPQKEEVRRQLARLREEEQQMLADVDEARQKMEQSSQQAQLADQRAQLDKTRAEAQQAAQSMQQGAPSQALASGTRAAKDLEAMRDEFRKKTSGQFKDEMRDMRADARELAERQQQIADKLQAKPAQAERPTLDGSGEREQLAEKFTKQQGDLSKLTVQMQRVSEQAEAAEPLLAKELYDTLRKTTQAGTGDTLDKTQKLAQAGYAKEARKFEEKARQEIEELKTGVERAAGSVLGDEAEALRQARAELDKLTEQLNREVAQARPDLAQQKPGEGADAKAPGSARVPRAGEGVPPSRTSGDAEKSERAASDATSQEVRPGETPGPARGTRALPGERQPGEQPTEGQGAPGTSGQGQRPENAPHQGQNPGQGEGQGQGQTPGQGRQGPGQGQDQGQGSQGAGRDGGGQASPTAQNANPAGQPGQQPGLPTSLRGQRGGGGGGASGGATDGEQAGPLTGDNFAEWSDRLRNVEEMVDSPALRTEVARIRETAQGVRADFKRHSLKPNWDLVNTKISAPLAELRNRLTEELARRESKESLVPIDRDPVPTKYAERVRRYYEELGRSGDR